MFADVLDRCGGVATRAELVAATSVGRVRRAVADGVLVRVARGQYAGPARVDFAQFARAANGVLCLESAALHHGWAVKQPPTRPQIVLPKGRRLRADLAPYATWHRTNLYSDDVAGPATSIDRTLDMCGRMLGFADALAVADSALRSGVSHRHLVALAAHSRGPGARQFRRVAALADSRAANPFESALRAICLGVSGLHVTAQLSLSVDGRDLHPDLVDPDLRIVIEADSYQWHGGRQALVADTIRYNALVVSGWMVLRFSFDQVMRHPEEVARVLVAAVRCAKPHTQCRCGLASAA